MVNDEDRRHNHDTVRKDGKEELVADVVEVCIMLEYRWYVKILFGIGSWCLHVDPAEIHRIMSFHDCLRI
jgi:hypothetical protein